MKKNISFRVAKMGILSALAIALNYLEGLLPTMAFLPPGAKIGLSNLIVMMAAYRYGLSGAVTIALIKALFVLATRGTVAFMMSLVGGILSAVATLIFIKWKKNPFGFVGIGITGAIFHNAGQLLVASCVLGSTAVFSYGPYLFIFALISGSLTGIMLKVTQPYLAKIDEYTC